MSRDAVALSDYVDHVITAIARIKRYTNGLDETGFHKVELVQDAVVPTSRSSAKHAGTFVDTSRLS